MENFLQKILTIVVERFTGWPLVFLIVVFLFRKRISQFLEAVTNMVSNISTISIGSIVLNKNVPEGVKTTLTNLFVEAQHDLRNIQKALKCLSILTYSLDKLVLFVRDNIRTAPQAIQDVMNHFNELYDALRLFIQEDTRIEIKLRLIEEIRTLLETTSKQAIGAEAFPSVQILAKLDAGWPEKKAREFEQIKELEEILLELLKKTKSF